jgi:hypothetical protein
VAAVGKLVKKYERNSDIQKKKQYTKQYKKHTIYKIENKRTKQENEHKKETEKP